MSGLPPGLRDFGTRLEQAVERELAERRRRRGRPALRRFGLPVAAALLAAAASAGAVRLTDGGHQERVDPDRADRAGSLAAAEDPAVVVASAVDDPHGGPPWAVRVYTNAAGRECVQVGQLRDGRLGREQEGRFRVLPRSASGTCAAGGSRQALIGVRRTGDLTLVFGLAVDRDQVLVRVGDQERHVRPVGLGAFVAVLADAGAHAVVRVRSSVRGRTTVQSFG